MHFLIDTNVAVVANGKSDAGSDCVTTAIERLEQLIAGEILVLDDNFKILNEYEKHLNSSGRPGPGDFFYQWAQRNKYNPKHCEQVTLPLADDGSFAAFPFVVELAKFDLSDRKFVAAALTHPANPPVVNASDKDWHECHEALRANGVQVEFLCLEEMLKARHKRGS